MHDDSPFNFSALNSSWNIPTENIETIVNKLMVDSWLPKASFSAYYNTCAPISCTFEYNSRNNIFIVVTTVMSIFGGLSLGYNLLILIILRCLEKIRNGFTRFSLIQFIKNVFSCHTEQQTIDRLHFLMVLTSLSVLYSLTAFIPRLIVVQIPKPEIDTYLDLMTRFPGSLQCPCKEIAIRHKTFLTILPRFHQVCTSDFVSDRWISYLFSESNLSDQFVPSDFRYSVGNQFQILVSLCQLSQETAKDMLLQFDTSSIVSDQLLSTIALNESIRMHVNQFQAQMPTLFFNTLSLIRQMTEANMLMSAFSTSWMYTGLKDYIREDTTVTAPVVYENCSCGVSSLCVQSIGSMLSACYFIEAFMQSSFRCLYDQQCIDPSKTFKAMNASSSISNRFDTNATVESIVSQLMMEDYEINMTYAHYFTECSPLSCSYSYIDKSNLLDGITSLIALYGGLMIICRSIAVLMVKIFRRPARVVIPTVN